MPLEFILGNFDGPKAIFETSLQKPIRFINQRAAGTLKSELILEKFSIRGKLISKKN